MEHLLDPENSVIRISVGLAEVYCATGLFNRPLWILPQETLREHTPRVTVEPPVHSPAK